MAPNSKFFAGEDSYILLTVKRDGPMIVEIKSLDGEELERQKYESSSESPK